MPFAGYETFDVCVLAQKNEGKSDEEARKICGALQAKAEEGNKSLKSGSYIGGTLVETKRGPISGLYLKYKLIDDSFGLSGFRLDNLSKIDNDAIGKPFPRQVENPLQTRMKDGHDWSMIPNAGYNEHLAHAWDHAEGYVVDISNETDRDPSIKGGSNDSFTVTNSTSKYVTLKIIDPERKELYLKNPKAIPKAVSIGIFDHDYGANGNVIKNYNVVHVMPVDNPAWPDAKHIGSCNGTEQICTAALRGAANSMSGFTVNTNLSSLDSSHQNKTNIMSANQSTDSTNTAATGTDAGNGAVARQPVLRLKTSVQNQGAPIANTTPQVQPVAAQTAQNLVSADPNAAANANANVQPKTIQDDPDLQKMNMQLQQLRKDAELEKKKNMIRSKIPRDKYVVKDKFNNEAFEKEVERMANKNWDEADFDSYYNNEREMLALVAAQRGGYSGYLSYQQQQLGAPSNDTGTGTPNALFGGSDNTSQKVTALKNVIRMIGGVQ